MSPLELTSAEEVLERLGWTVISRNWNGLGWSATAVSNHGAIKHYADEQPTRHDARAAVVASALETQAILDGHSDTERPGPMPEAAE
jgi:hypothetical protein